jgi:histidinol-phosphate aminotransferase
VNASQLVRPDVLAIPPVAHGSVAAEELAQFGLTLADVLDFSVNTNPLGPAPVVLRAVQATDWTRYPGDDDAPLRRGLAQLNGVTREEVALGNGSVELMWLIALASLSAGDHVAVIGPTFGEYVRAAQAVGACAHGVTQLTDLPTARVVFICNPNNPTGEYRAQSDIERLLSEHADRLIVLDEAYAAFVDHRWPSQPLLERFPNLAILRSLTKEHAVPGLRLGYLLATPTLISAIEAVRPPWSVNAGALRAGLATLESEADAHVTRARALVTESRRVLTEGLTGLGCRVSPSVANFVLAHVGDGAAFRRALMPHGIVVRDCSSFGLPECVRIACKLPEQCARLVETVRCLNV